MRHYSHGGYGVTVALQVSEESYRRGDGGGAGSNPASHQSNRQQERVMNSRVVILLRFYFVAFVLLPIAKYKLIPSKRIRGEIAMYGLKVCADTLCWKIKMGHKK